MKLFTAAASTTTTAQVTFCPQFLYFVASTVPTALKVTPLGESPICDLDGAGITALGTVRIQGRIANSYLIPLADGVIKNKTTEIVFTNAVASGVDVFGISLESGTCFIQSLRQTVLASSGIDIKDFSVLAMPSIAAGDIVNYTFREGTVQKMERDEIAAILQLTQNVVGGYVIDNLDARISNVNYIPASTQVVYLQRVVPAGTPAPAFVRV